MGSLEFLLVVMVCSNIDGDCQWQRVGRFSSEEICVMNGLAVDPVVIRFKCVQLVREPEHIPLPRARPQAKKEGAK